MNPEAGRADLDFLELPGLGILQSLRIMRRKAHIEPGTELNYNAAIVAVVVGGNGLRNCRL